MPSTVELQAYADQQADQYGLDRGLFRALIDSESSWQVNPKTAKMSDGSPSDARGIAQFRPGTARQYGVDVNNPHSSIRGAANYLADLKDKYSGDMMKAVAAYKGYSDPGGARARDEVANLLQGHGYTGLAKDVPSDTGGGWFSGLGDVLSNVFSNSGDSAVAGAKTGAGLDNTGFTLQSLWDSPITTTIVFLAGFLLVGLGLWLLVKDSNGRDVVEMVAA